MAKPQDHDWVKQALDLGPVLAFVAMYLWLREDTVHLFGRDWKGFVVVTAVFIPLLVVTNWLLYRRTGHVSRMQILTLVLAVVFGGLTVALNDESFFKMKSTLAFGMFSGILWFGIARGQSYLEYIMDGALPLTHEGWMILTRRMAWLFAAVAVANEIIWRNFSNDVFVAWDTFGQMGAMMVFFLCQSKLFQRHAQEEPEKGA